MEALGRMRRVVEGRGGMWRDIGEHGGKWREMGDGRSGAGGEQHPLST